MAFGAPDTKEEADQRYNPADTASDLYAKENAATDQIDNNLGDSGRTNDINSASDSLNNQESAAGNSGFYEPSKNNLSGGKTPLNIKTLMKKKGGIFSIIAILLGGGGIMAGFFGPATMLINVMENFHANNDSASTVKEHRMKHVFKNMTTKESIGCIGKNTIKCKTGRISNRALGRLAKNGIVPVGIDGSPIEIGKSGYPTKNPTHYSIDGGKPIKAADLSDELLKKGNEKLASKVYGRYGAFKMHVRAWTGKNIKNRLLNKFKLSRSGGVVAKIDNKLKVSDRIKAIKAKTPKLDASKAYASVNKKIEKHTGKLSKGGVTYAMAGVYCMGVKLPGIVATGVTAVQLAPIVAIVMDTVLSPASRAKAAGFGSGFTSEMADTVGTMLTERGITEGSTNKTGSALDSKYLLAAMGINKNKSAISSYVPGYSIYKSPFVQGAKELNESSEPFCNTVMSPAAMYASLSIEAGLAAFSGGIGAVVSFVGKQTIKQAALMLTQKIVTDTLMGYLADFAKNDMLPKARYMDLGDAIGIGAAAFFSSGGMTQGLPVLKNSQLAEFNQIYLANEEFQKNMDIASLSPFDTSSQYTFLGNIVRNIGNMMLTNGTYNNNFSSILSNIIKLPSFALSYSNKAKASSGGIFSGNYCNYASDFGHSTDGDDPAVNMAGLPCTGITKEQANMSTEEALDIAINEGWIKGDKEIPEGATIDELGIDKDSPLAEFLDSCSDASTGDYWTNTGGCTIPSGVGSGNTGQNSYNGKDKNGEDITITAESLGANENGPGPIDNKKFAAMSVLLIDYQINQSINGEDEEPEEKTGPQADSTGDIVKAGEIFFDYTYYYGGPAFHGSVDTMKNTIESIKNGSLAKGTMLTDCSGFVRASIYAATGFDIEAGYTGAYSSYVGKTMDEVSINDLKPGDIAWKSGHVEIVTSVEGGQVYTQGARGPNDGGPIGGPAVLGGWTKYYRAKV